jgi:hypothetical protein
MKRSLLLLVALSSFAGCMSTPTAHPLASTKIVSGGNAHGPQGADADAHLNERLPVTTPGSITVDNHQAKFQELADELNRESRRLDSARRVAEAPR